MQAVLGIDTSNYTTSAAIYISESNEIINSKRLLPVESGARGLRQSDALFYHTRALPQIIDNAFSGNNYKISAVGVSDKPRDADGSYMPCFLAGVSAASAAAAVINCNLHRFSHQRGHIMAALYSANRMDLVKKPFLAFHVSGGTTEMLLVKPDDELVISCNLLAATLDLNAGQVIDRAGVMIGLGFPAGKALDELSKSGKLTRKINVKLKSGSCCLSGVENICKNMLLANEKPEDIARFTIEYILQTIKEMTAFGLSKYGNMPVVYAGGVMSNSHISAELPQYFDCTFAKPEFSCDNAAGIAVLTAIKEGMIKI